MVTFNDSKEKLNFDNLKKELKTKTFSKIDAELIIKVANTEGQNISEKGVTNNQIRKFYDVIKNIERKCFNLKDEDELSDDVKSQLLFLKPHLVNAAKKKEEMKRISDIMTDCIDLKHIKTKSDLKNFIRFFESIIAFSK